MTPRLIDLMCDEHREQVLTTRMWAHEYNDSCWACAGESTFTALPGLDVTTEHAVHEAGHAVAYLLDGIRVYEVSIGGNDQFAAYTHSEGHDRGTLAGLTGLWAGGAATRYWLRRSGLLDAAAEVDVAMASRTDTRLITEHAPDNALVVEARDRADRLVGQHWWSIERLVDSLLCRRSVSGAGVASAAGLEVPA